MMEIIKYVKLLSLYFGTETISAGSKNSSDNKDDDKDIKI